MQIHRSLGYENLSKIMGAILIFVSDWPSDS